MNTPFYRNALAASRAFGIIKNDIAARKLGHAYLVISPDGEAIKKLFMLVSEAVYCRYGGCGECADCLKVLHDNNPDLKHVNLIGDNITKDHVEAVLKDAQLKPFYDAPKLYMIYRSDLMNLTAQNKLLKTLEEPPPAVTIFLGAAQEAALLPTIKSRARKIYLDFFEKDVIYRAVLNYTEDEKKAALAAACSDGYLTRAYEIASSKDFLERYEEAIALLMSLDTSAKVLDAVNLDIASKARLPELLNILSPIFRDVMAVSAGAKPSVLSELSDEIVKLGAHFSPSAAAKAIMAVNKAREMLYFNVGAAAAAEKLFFDILELRT
ncbi:MAG TPA: hypothetical protein P5161_01525 [Eubacteriales bacterium]|nr:hypothetical protein [Clostridia bacterium]HRR89448.1 hypothetical protein [Eubacteriales bacterium]HRU83792.1 hypothetical protein [Eubacteriales bacterium]